MRWKCDTGLGGSDPLRPLLPDLVKQVPIYGLKDISCSAESIQAVLRGRQLAKPLYPSAWSEGKRWKAAEEPRLQVLACIEAWRDEIGVRPRCRKERYYS